MAEIVNKSGVSLDTDWLPIIRYNYVRYTGASDSQARYRAPNDPRPVLEEGEVYRVSTYVVRGSSTRVLLEDVDGQFNSVCFEGVNKEALHWKGKLDVLLGVVAQAFGWEDESFLHAVTHVEHAVNNMESDRRVAERAYRRFKDTVLRNITIRRGKVQAINCSGMMDDLKELVG